MNLSFCDVIKGNLNRKKVLKKKEYKPSEKPNDLFHVAFLQAFH